MSASPITPLALSAPQAGAGGVTIGSLCTGYGGLDMAVEQMTGGETVWVADSEPGPAAILAHRRPHVPNLGDITKVTWEDAVRIDILAAGFPCTDISNAGKRVGIRGKRSGIWTNVAEAVRRLRPGLVVLENVAAIRTRGLGVVIADLAAIGYDARWTCLRAGDPETGAPHRRDRWICIAHPAASDALGGGRDRWAGYLTEAAGRDEPAHRGDEAAGSAGMSLLPTPKASDGPHGGPNQRDAAGNYYLPGVAVRLDERWVSVDGADYGPAIRRWENILGRPAPCPTEPGTRGNRRLSPLFVEWMMGAPEGHVTAVPGLSRPQQIKALGNGAMPQQVVTGINFLTGRAAVA